jgi:guanine deaminase
MAASAPISKTIYFGPFVHSKSLTELDICEKGAIGVDEHGVIRFVERDIELGEVQKQHGEWKEATVVKIDGNGFFFPGFIGMYPYRYKMINSQRHISTKILLPPIATTVLFVLR